MENLQIERELQKLSEYRYIKQPMRNGNGYIMLDAEGKPMYQITGEKPEITAIYNILQALYNNMRGEL